MRTILILGAGRSSSSLIRYLLENASKYEWQILVGDLFEAAAKERIGESPAGSFIHFDINKEEESHHAISRADLVISLLPPVFHPLVAKHCLRAGKHLFTASYVSEEMLQYHRDAVGKGLLFLNECGLDPGIDHMSAMLIIDRIRHNGGTISSFKSFTGGLIAPETDRDNPWRYKFTWNPRNVVMAGQGVAKYLEGGEFKYVPYQRLFERLTLIDIPGHGSFEGYLNRDSLKYIPTYGLQNIKTMVRGTLRNRGFCDAWNVLVQLGCCEDSFNVQGIGSMTHADFIRSFLPGDTIKGGLEETVAKYLQLTSENSLLNLRWSGLFSDEPVGLDTGTPAQILEHILNKKWKLNEWDKDMIVMHHRFTFEINGGEKNIMASLISKGENATYTAMAKTVGLPLAIASKLLLTDQIKERGVVIPLTPEFYAPILKELEQNGIAMVEEEIG